MERELEFLNAFLNYIYNCTIVNEYGQVCEQRQQVEKVGNLKIEIYPNEHPPPHFHVKGPNIDASFTVLDGKYMYGEIDSKSKKKIQYYHASIRTKLIDAWNNLRPDDCPVGKIQPPN